MTIRGAIFDLDGTLLDSMAVWDTIGADYLRSIGGEPAPGLDRVFKTMSLVEAARYYQTEYGVTRSVPEILDGVNAMLDRFYRLEAALKPGAADLLARLARRGVRLCVATATDRPLVEAALTRLGVLGYFGAVFTCTEVGAGKDRPAIFEAALAHLGTRRAETWVFDDALYALRTAKAAGFPVAAVYDVHEPDQAAVRALADVYLTTLEGACP